MRAHTVTNYREMDDVIGLESVYQLTCVEDVSKCTDGFCLMI